MGYKHNQNDKINSNINGNVGVKGQQMDLQTLLENIIMIMNQQQQQLEILQFSVDYMLNKLFENGLDTQEQYTEQVKQHIEEIKKQQEEMMRKQQSGIQVQEIRPEGVKETKSGLIIPDIPDDNN